VACSIILHGACGRVGKAIGKRVCNDDSCVLSACCEYPGHPDTGKPYNSVIGVDTTLPEIATSLESVDFRTSCIIDFSSPEGTRNLAGYLTSMKNEDLPAGMVVGTTGLENHDIHALQEVSRRFPVLFSPNMSFGINYLFFLCKHAAETLGPAFDVEIIEAHHGNKVDAPSGTARKCAEIIADARHLVYDKDMRHGRVGMVGKRSKDEIGIHAVRGGDIVGDHTILFAGSGERLEFRHQAHSRETFAQGAVSAARWIVEQQPGFYSMQDMLGLNSGALCTEQ